MAISKTDYLRGLQCPRMVWLFKHKPEEQIIPPEVEERLDAGNDFGDEAMSYFGDFVETTAYKEDGRLDYKKMIERTKECLEEGTPVICEAAFSYLGNYCAVDILRRAEDGFELYEVKNSPAVKEVFLFDVAFQKYILKKCGVNVKRCYLLLHGEEGIFAENISGVLYPYERQAYTKVWEISKLKFSKEEVLFPVGEQCLSPYRCFFYEYCHRENQN